MQGPGTAGPSASGGFPFSLNDLAGLSVLGQKNATDLFNMYKYQNDGVKQEAGNYYRDPTTGAVRYMPKVDVGMGFDGSGNVTPLNGYARANANIKGTEAGAVAQAKMPFDIATDRSRQLTQAQLDTQPTVGADGNTYYTPRAQIALGGAGVASGYAGAMGGLGPGVGAGGVAGASPGGYMASRNPITQQSSIALNDNWVKNMLNPVQESGKSALDLQNSIQAIRNTDMSTGWGTEQKAAAANVLTGLGMAPASAQLYAANAQKFQSIAMDRLQTSLIAQKGTQTEGDAQRAGQTFASLKNTPEANQFILDFAQAKTNADLAKAKFYESALPLAQKKGDLTAVDRAWRQVGYSVWNDPVLQQWKKGN
ncbi:hypothetical protein SRS16CHR_02580 [Variovorax sp. SRS16]|nr:hypothetical protein SRS16CHR_02580 [Variovorax sp. SRS16]